LTNPDNKGLDVPINALTPIVTKYKGLMSRTDVWVLATLVGSQVSQPKNADFKVDFALTEFGRIDCEKQQSVCRNEAGVSHGCSATRGPHRVLPGANTNSHDLFAFFSNNFGFNQRETVAILGAHTIGVLNRKNSGIDGPNGWVVENRILDNGYYVELVGPSGNLVQGAPNWKRHFEDNSDLPQADLNVWHGLPPALNGRFIVMLDSDIAIVRNLNGNNMNSKTGQVSCQFIDRSGNDPTCPQLSGALQEAARYKFSNRAWLIDFQSVLRKMSNRGYSITSNCIGGLCKLAKN
jgi:Peroxidase